MVVDSNLRNLSEVVLWARAHEPEVAQMISNANRITEAATSLKGIRVYLRRLLQQYTSQYVSHSPKRHQRAVRLTCKAEVDANRTCEVPGSTRHHRHLQRVRCQFRIPGGKQFDNLHDAATAAGLNHAQPSVSSDTSAIHQSTGHSSPSLLCSTTARTSARTNGRWCYDFATPEECHQHFVPGAPTSSCGRRPCVWTTELREWDAKGRSCQASRKPDERVAACVAVCCSGEFCTNRTRQEV